jgi:hypothetical protein
MDYPTRRSSGAPIDHTGGITLIRSGSAAAVAAVATVLALAAPAFARSDYQDVVQPFTRDVFVIVGSTLRNPDETTAADANLFNNAGVSLGLDWGQFSSASATARAQQLGGAKNAQTDVRVDLTGLVPGGLYSLFYITLGPDSENPLCPGVERSLPLTAFHPSSGQPDAASFYADATGAASFHGRVPGALLDAQQLIYTVVYHAYGQSYGSLPNAGESLTRGANCRSSFGEDSMRQSVIYQKYN